MLPGGVETTRKTLRKNFDIVAIICYTVYMIYIQCKNCKKEFLIKPSQEKRRRFCSVECKSISQIGVSTWNKGLTKETDKRVKQYGKNGSKTIKKQFENGRKSPLGMSGYNHTEEHILWLQQRFGGKDNPFYGKKHSTIAREKIRKATIQNVISGNNRFSYTKPERMFYEELEKRKINYIPQFNLNDKFAVDVYLPDTNTLVQVDGNYWHNLDRVKKKDKSFNAYATTCGYNLKRFWELDIYENVGKCIDSL